MDTTARVIVATGRHRPHEVVFFAWSVYTGVPFVLGWAVPNSTDRLGHWSLVTMAAGLILCGVSGLAGCFWQGDVRTGLGIERGSLVMRAGLAMLLAVLIFMSAGERAWSSGGFMIWLATADLWRGWIITRDLRRIRYEVEGDRRRER